MSELVNRRNLKEITLVVTGILASISISGGVIAFFAHNWDDLPSIVRKIIAFIPAILGISCFSYAFLKHHLSRVWMESSTVFLMLMMGSSIGLVAQVYNMGGTFENFLFTWMILTVPLIYIGRSSATALLYLAGITWWLILVFFGSLSFFELGNRAEQLQWWLLFAAYIPHFIMYVKPGMITLRGVILGWFTGVILIFSSYFSFSGHYLFNYIAVIMMVYGAGKYYFPNQKFFWTRPFQTLALIGLLTVALTYSSKNAFEEYVKFEGYVSAAWGDVFSSANKYLNIFPFLVNILLAYYFWEKIQKNNGKINLFIYLFPVVMAVGVVFGMLGWSIVAGILINLYILCTGCNYVYQGMEKNLPSIVLLGVIIICIVLTVRYFDINISFWLKAILYTGVGASALWFNNYYSNKISNAQ